MQRGEADIALNAFIVTKDRSEIGNYLSFDDDEYGLIYITNPKDTLIGRSTQSNTEQRHG